MKKKLLTILLTLTAICGTIFAGACATDEQINTGIELAKQIAMEHTGATIEDIQSITATQEIVDSKIYYNVELVISGIKFNYKVDVADESITKLAINDQNVDVETAPPIPSIDTSENPVDPPVMDPEEPVVPPVVDPETPVEPPVADPVYIGVDAAISIALQDADVHESNALKLKADLDFDDGQYLYEIKFNTDSAKYEYEIVAVDGSIYKKDVDMKTVVQPTAPQTDPEKTYITVDEAKQIALTDAQISEDVEVFFDKVKFEKEKGAHIFEVEFTSNGVEYEYDINAITGAIIKKEFEGKEHENIPTPEGYIGIDRAKEIALAHAGYTADQVVFREAKMDVDRGVYEYEIEFEAGRIELEYEINAVTGEIIKAEREIDD